MELSYTENWLGLPRHFLYLGGLALTVILIGIFLIKERIRIGFKETCYVISLIIISLLIISATEYFHKKYFWPKYPSIKIGDKIIYNQH